MSTKIQEPEIIDYDAYRDSIGTVDESGKRNWIYPKKPQGRFYNARKWVSYVLLGLLFAGPFLRWNGEPFLLFNILERKFILFGITFWPQDFHLFVIAMLTFMVFIVLFTVIYGRVWCGWACPQTIFMEMVFRRIEYWIEGDNHKQRKLNNSPWNWEKTWKKGLKFSIFLFISFLIGNLVMAYLVGTDELKELVTHPPSENWAKFVGVVFFSGIFFFVFSYFREQACIAVCPYGRLQGVMLGKDSVVVAYDYKRGETRGRIKRGQDRSNLGDCISCNLCVQVCPTGIDIRDGTQMECVNCTACIDACDGVMDKVGFPRGLIRYASHTNIEEGSNFKLTPRIVAYSVVLIGLLSILGFSLANRSDIETTVLRSKGMMFQRLDDGYISNLYNLQLINKTQEAYTVRLEAAWEDARIKQVGKALNVPAGGMAKGAFFLELPENSLNGLKNKVTLSIYDEEGKLLDKTRTTFMGPAN